MESGENVCLGGRWRERADDLRRGLRLEDGGLSSEGLIIRSSVAEVSSGCEHEIPFGNVEGGEGVKRTSYKHHIQVQPP